MIEEKNYKWTNWAGNQTCSAENYFEPQSEQEIIEIVRFAGKNKKKIRMVGEGHSFSPIAINNEILISLKRYRKLISVDKYFVRCQAGMYLSELYATLKANNYSFPNFGVINKQTIAGALATGTHGSGLMHGSLSKEIEKLRIIQSSGKVLEINRETTITIGKKKLNIWEAASISLGLLGIVTEITLKCESLFYLKSEESIIEFDEFIKYMDHYAKEYEYFKAWWFPHTDKIYVFKTQRIEKKYYDQKNKTQKYTNEQKKRDLDLDKLTRPMFIKSRDDRSLIPTINAYCLTYFFTPRIRIGDSFEILVHEETVPMVVSEYGLPMIDNIHKKALKEFRDVLEKSEHKIHFPIDLRYVRAENSWLSPSYKKDIFYIGVALREYHEKEIHPSMQLFFDIMRKYNACPNWGKLSDLSKQELEERFSAIDRFREVRKHMDPSGMFLNEFLKNIL